MLCLLEWVYITVPSVYIYSQNNLEQHSKPLRVSFPRKVNMQNGKLQKKG